MRFIFERFVGGHLPAADKLALGEILFDETNRKLLCGLGGKQPPAIVAVVYEGPDGALYHKTPEGYIPLCIRMP